jgi:hypothetical protein
MFVLFKPGLFDGYYLVQRTPCSASHYIRPFTDGWLDVLVNSGYAEPHDIGIHVTILDELPKSKELE